MSQESLYTRLGGYDAIAAVADNLLPRLMADELLGRFWEHRGTDGIVREKQLLIDMLCNVAGGPVYYTGRNMKVTHAGMRINEADWANFMIHVKENLGSFLMFQSKNNQKSLGLFQAPKKKSLKKVNSPTIF